MGNQYQKSGTIIFIGLFIGDFSFHDPLFHKKEITLKSSRNAVATDFTKLICLLKSGLVNIDGLITHRVAFDSLIENWDKLYLPEEKVIKAVYERLTVIDKAITAYQKAIDFAPNYYEPHYNLGVLYYNRAIDIYDSWRKMNPEEDKSKEIKKELIILLSKAKPHVVKALELNPAMAHLEKALKNINHFVN